MIFGEIAIVNAEKASYSRLVQQNLSCLARGLDGAIINSKWVDSASVIFVLWVTDNDLESLAITRQKPAGLLDSFWSYRNSSFCAFEKIRIKLQLH